MQKFNFTIEYQNVFPIDGTNFTSIDPAKVRWPRPEHRQSLPTPPSCLPSASTGLPGGGQEEKTDQELLVYLLSLARQLPSGETAGHCQRKIRGLAAQIAIPLKPQLTLLCLYLLCAELGRQPSPLFRIYPTPKSGLISSTYTGPLLRTMSKCTFHEIVGFIIGGWCACSWSASPASM